MNTPAQIAQQVLDNHAIQPGWKRSTEQITPLLVEAATMATAHDFTHLDELIRESDEAACGNSNDEEIQSLAGALDAALYLLGYTGTEIQEDSE
jgi:hypothetical protein